MKRNYSFFPALMTALFMLALPLTVAGSSRGDVNDNGEVTIADVTTLVDLILGK